MLKKTFLAAMIAVLMVVVPAWAGVDPVDGTPWDEDVDLFGHPVADYGWQMVGNNYHQYNSRLGDGNPVGGTPGYMIATGNPNNYYYKPDAVNLTQAAGWTYEYEFATHPSMPAGQPGIEAEELRIHDGSWTSLFLSPNPDGDANTDDGYVRIADRYWNLPSVQAPLTFYDGSPTGLEHTYRLVRQPGSATVELYVDNDFSAPYLQLAPLAVGGGAGPYGVQVASLSNLEGNVGGWRYHAGASIPPPTVLLGDANLDGLVSADDFASVQVNFGNSGPADGTLAGDANHDGLVSADDFASVQVNFGNHLPEPATLGLLAVGLIAIFRRRSK